MNITVLATNKMSEQLIKGLATFGNKENNVTYVCDIFKDDSLPEYNYYDGVMNVYKHLYGCENGQDSAYNFLFIQKFKVSDYNISELLSKYCNFLGIDFVYEYVKDFIDIFQFNPSLYDVPLNIFNMVCYILFDKYSDAEACNILGDLLHIKSKVVINYHKDTKLKYVSKFGTIEDFPTTNTMDILFIGELEGNEYINNMCSILQSSDLLIVSEGTLWGNVLPSLKYSELFNHINELTCNKVIILNSTCNNEGMLKLTNAFRYFMFSHIGLNMPDYSIVGDSGGDAYSRIPNENIIFFDMFDGEDKNPQKLVESINSICEGVV